MQTGLGKEVELKKYIYKETKEWFKATEMVAGSTECRTLTYDIACGDLDRDQIPTSFNFAYNCVVDEVNQGMDS